ncbi:hypothetical protein ALC53_08674 [Atta colombica]|uniref:Chitin-binding type-2 domain-containing protein n=1 Tax=Atta colombica TaxID=520822 RepID=A0A151I285_9HYME|nr:hypothetical protein ALC53_08674 [Atta colombica]
MRSRERNESENMGIAVRSFQQHPTVCYVRMQCVPTDRPHVTFRGKHGFTLYYDSRICTFETAKQNEYRKLTQVTDSRERACLFARNVVTILQGCGIDHLSANMNNEIGSNTFAIINQAERSCLVTTVLCIVQRSLEHGVSRSFLSRRAIDGTRGKKYFDPNEDGAFDSYGSAGGQYEPFDHITDLSDIRKNVPGEPGIDYPAYMTLPQTGFTCEGRSRGYYADEAAGCQVFHVCHDVLVSSFLCPIGSTFSQKLLTCDWWTKVDCSSTKRYLEVNRNNYQIDDDEMIRNAYAMISLQVSAEDVTKDGLVDPDSGARIDYSTLGGRPVMGYTPGFRRITDYAPVEATGNDLPSGFEDYSQQDARQIFNYDLHYQQKKVNDPYQSKLHLENKGQSPYHASAIIQHDYQDRSGGNKFQNDYHGPDGFTNQLQTSYAPTVPTVTTTTRRFYSPTVPTTYRPSTLAYSKLDLMVDSSDHLYAQSKTPVTPPTITHQNDDMRKIDLRESETGHDLKKSKNASSSITDDQKGDNVHFKNDEVHLEETSEANFRIDVTDAIDEDEVFRQQNDKPIIQYNSEENLEDSLETKDSIGIARALNNPFRKIIQNQNPIYQVSKDKWKDSTTPIPLHTVLNHSSESYEKVDDVNLSDNLKKSNIFNETSDDRSTEDYEDTLSLSTRSFVHGMIPLLKNWKQKDVDAVQVMTTSITAISAINSTERNIDEIHGGIIQSSSNDNRTAEDQNLSPTRSNSSFNHESVPRINLNFEVPEPAQFIKPPLEQRNFLINVPEETRYTMIDENFKISWSPETITETPRFSSTFAGNNEDQSPIYEELIDYTDESFLETPSSGIHSTAQVITEISTPIPWLVSTWHDRSTIVDIPVTDIVPPIIDYSDEFGGFALPNENYTEQLDYTKPVDSQRTQSSLTTSKKNDSEANILTQYNTGFQFTVRDAIKIQKEINENFRCSSISDKQGGRCETSSSTPKIAVSTPSVNERIISIGTKATTKISDQLIFSDNSKNLKLPESTKSLKLSKESVTSIPDKYLTFTTKSINSDINVASTTLKTITPRAILEIKNPEKKIEKTVETTVSNLSSSIYSESLKQIEEMIDKQDPYKVSPYEVAYTVKKDDDLETTSDDFISRLIAQQQRSDSLLKDELNDFEIIKSDEPSETEISSILHTSKFPDTSHASPNNASNDSFYVTENDTTSEFEQSDSNMSMVSLLQLMAELLKLDRLPRPFSTKDLSSIKDSFNLNLDESSYDTTNPPLNYPQIGTTYKNTSPKASTLKTPAESLNLHFNKPFLVTGSPLDYSRARTPFENANSKTSFLDETSETPINVDLKPPNVFSKVSFNNVTEQKTGQSKPENKIARPLQKEKILEQLTENFGKPLYHGDLIYRPLVFDLPQVQRSLNFETGLPIEESEYETNETKTESPGSTTRPATTTIATTTTTESVKTTIETEFVPSLGFSLDTKEGREEYVQAVLGGLIDEHTGESDGNESSIVQNKALKNETLDSE